MVKEFDLRLVELAAGVAVDHDILSFAVCSRFLECRESVGQLVKTTEGVLQRQFYPSSEQDVFPSFSSALAQAHVIVDGILRCDGLLNAVGESAGDELETNHVQKDDARGVEVVVVSLRHSYCAAVCSSRDVSR